MVCKGGLKPVQFLHRNSFCAGIRARPDGTLNKPLRVIALASPICNTSVPDAKPMRMGVRDVGRRSKPLIWVLTLCTKHTDQPEA